MYVYEIFEFISGLVLLMVLFLTWNYVLGPDVQKKSVTKHDESIMGDVMQKQFD